MVTNHEESAMNKLTSDELFDYWECEVVPPHRRLKYGFQLEHGEEKLWMTEYGFLHEPPSNPDRLFEYPYINPVDVFKTPAWVKDAIFYQIFLSGLPMVMHLLIL